jgi:hypothetical protein
VSIYHITAFDFAIEVPLLKECNDADVGYTCVDADPEGGMTCGGTLSFQDSTITSSKLKSMDLLLAARGPLVLTVAQSGGAANKVITIAGVIFTSADENAQASADRPNEHSVTYEVSNDATTVLTLTGANKIITIANAA